MHPPLPQPLSTCKKIVGPELKEGIIVRDIKYLLPQRKGKLASPAPQRKIVTPPFVLGWFFLETNHEGIWLTSAMNFMAPRFGAKPHYDHQTLAQVISEVLLRDLNGGERNSRMPCLPSAENFLQSLDTFAFLLSIKFSWNTYSVSRLKPGTMGNGAFPKNVS